jgi:hypothetical protein
MISKLQALMVNDPLLKKTVPTRSYDLDPVQVEKFNTVNDFQGPSSRMTVHKISFNDIIIGLGKCFDRMEAGLQKGYKLYVSNGISENDKQSASEKWIFYMIEKLFADYNITPTMGDDHWVSLVKDPTNITSRVFVLVDDFMNSGRHTVFRIYESDLMKRFPSYGISVLVGSADVNNPFMDIFKDAIYQYPDNPVNINRISIFIGSPFKRDRESDVRLLLEHKSLENIHDDLYLGFVGKQGHIGSLIEGWDATSDRQYPPALYHIVFGKGVIPKSMGTEPLKW